MKVFSFTIPKPKRDALILQEDKTESLYELFHQHEEFQISYIKQGQGTLLVGDAINYYKPGDLVVLGGNLPHVFRSDRSKSDLSHMYMVFFTQASFGSDFFNTEELKELAPFFRKARHGFKVSGNTKPLIETFEVMYNGSKLERFISFLQLLKQLNTCRYEPLSSFVSEKKYSDNEGRRMSAVYEYTMANFQKEISLETIAKEAAMTRNAFCKYFKKKTNKTYISFLNELRVEEACKLLQSQSELSIAEIAEASGFQNISNFNRRFKTLKGKTPREYSKAFS